MADGTDNGLPAPIRHALRDGVAPVADDGFSDRVAARLRMAIIRRRLVVWAATIAGVIVALPAAVDVLALAGSGLASLAASGPADDGGLRLLLDLAPVREGLDAAARLLADTGHALDVSSMERAVASPLLLVLGAIGALLAPRLLE